MIERYQIKTFDEEEVLYLYLDYSYEFGDFFSNKNISNIKEKIKEYITKMKINFKGSKILLVVGGISLTTIFLTPMDISDIELSRINYISNSIVLKITNTDNSFENLEQKIETEESLDVEILENNELNNVVNTQTNEKNDENITIQIPDKNSPEVVDTSSTEIIELEEPIIETKEETFTQEVVPQNLITIYRTNGTVLQIPFEDYIVGVVAAEMPASFPVEALKAQAVVARTYAKQRLSKGLTLTDSVSTQSYKDEKELRTMWGGSYDTYYSKIKSAVDATKDLSIYYNGNYIDAVYHSTSNGYTEDSVYVWGNSIPYLKSVSSPWDISATPYLRVEEKSEQILLDTLGLTLSSDTVIEIISRDASGRVLKVRIGDFLYDGVTLRNILGLRSADFDLEVRNGSLVVTTRGYGHGVGMSQYGAAGMARDGYSYIDILKHYYTGVSIY